MNSIWKKILIGCAIGVIVGAIAGVIIGLAELPRWMHGAVTGVTVLIIYLAFQSRQPR
jgi:ABC-type glucose/galactose transport system permease subunit